MPRRSERAHVAQTLADIQSVRTTFRQSVEDPAGDVITGRKRKRDLLDAEGHDDEDFDSVLYGDEDYMFLQLLDESEADSDTESATVCARRNESVSAPYYDSNTTMFDLLKESLLLPRYRAPRNAKFNKETKATTLEACFRQGWFEDPRLFEKALDILNGTLALERERLEYARERDNADRELARQRESNRVELEMARIRVQESYLKYKRRRRGSGSAESSK
ncbi:hypothetical protein EDC01DRAFT_404553 [Geopyxis carbonaria]|nr:hypothetical protein EDC01DRAFT_404553 [Geopyxis carbonaria]